VAEVGGFEGRARKEMLNGEMIFITILARGTKKNLKKRGTHK